MSINETVKSFLLHKHHEFAEKTRIGRAAERIWVKHQFKQKGILNPKNYTQKEMDTFYSIIASNYVHLHKTYPQVLNTDWVYDAKILGLDPNQPITHADLFLHRVISKARTVEFRKIIDPKARGQTFGTGMMVDTNKTSSSESNAYAFFKTGKYLTDPNCPASFATILKDSSVNFGGMLGFILSSKESRKAFVADPKGFIDKQLAQTPNVKLEPEQQLSMYAMLSPTFVEAVKENEEYIESVEASLAEQQLKETTSHEAFHLGLNMAPTSMLVESLEQSYANADIVAGVVTPPENTEVTDTATPLENAGQKEVMESSLPPDMPDTTNLRYPKALNEIYISMLAARTNDSPMRVTRAPSMKGDNQIYNFNIVTHSAYTINEPIYGLLENMVAFSDGSTIAIQNFLSGVTRGEDHEFLPYNTLFDPRTSAFNLVGKDGKVNLPPQFNGLIKDTTFFEKADPFATFCELADDILAVYENKPEILASELSAGPMLQQMQLMLFQSFNQQISNVAENVVGVFNGNPTNEEMANLLLDVTAKEEIVQNMFTNLVFERDGSVPYEQYNSFITKTYGEDADLQTVLQSPKTVDEIQALIDNNVIVNSPLVATYMTTLSNMQNIREVVETSVLSQNPNLDENQLNTLLEITNPNPYAQMVEIEATVASDFGLSLQNALNKVQDSSVVNTLETEAGQMSADGTLATDTTFSADLNKVKVATTSTDLSAGGNALGMDMGGCDIGG